MERDDLHLLKRYYDGACTPDEIAHIPAVYKTVAGRHTFLALLKAVDLRTGAPEFDDSAEAYAALERRLAGWSEAPSKSKYELPANQLRREPMSGKRLVGRRTLQNILRFPISKRVVSLMLGLMVITIVTAKTVISHSALVRATNRTAPNLLLDTLHLVRFLLDAPPGARTIAITGNFTGHGESRTSLQYDRVHGQWSGVLVLAPGTYHYRFVVNDTGRLLDPHARTITDENGRRVSVVTVTANGAPLANSARVPHDT